MTEPLPPPHLAPRARRLGPLFGWALCLVLPTLAGLWRVHISVDTLRLGYALSQARQRQEAAMARAHELRVAVAAQVAPARLVELGARLALRPPAAGEIIGAPPRPAPAATAAAAPPPPAGDPARR